jgi:hypothetical protein
MYSQQFCDKGFKCQLNYEILRIQAGQEIVLYYCSRVRFERELNRTGVTVEAEFSVPSVKLQNRVFRCPPRKKFLGAPPFLQNAFFQFSQLKSETESCISLHSIRYNRVRKMYFLFQI